MSAYGKNRPLYTKRQWRETQRILRQRGYALAHKIDGLNILAYTKAGGESVVVQLYTPLSTKPNNGILTFISPEPGMGHETVGMWDFVKREKISAARPGIPRLITRIVETIRNM